MVTYLAYLSNTLLLILCFRRIAFTGGTNVTLRGSLNPKWGWIDGHGQAVSFD
jgi:hypothetical protein